MTLVAIAHEDRRALIQARPEERLPADAVMRSVEAIERVCARVGWPSKRLVVGGSQGSGLDWTRGLLEDLDRIAPDVVFNLVEGVSGDARLQAAVAWMLELSDIPYTGSRPEGLSFALDKPVMKALLRAQGIAVPAGRLAERGDEIFAGLELPFIVKPSRERGSRGILLESVAGDEAHALRQVLRVARAFKQPALVEEFASGPEFRAIILGAGEACELLPLSQIDYAAFPSGKRPLVTFNARWDDSTAECIGAACVAAEGLDAGLHADLAAAALGAYRALGIRDYGCVELRVHPERGPVVIDVNANPDLSPGSGVSRAAARVGLKHADLIERLIEGAVRRGQGP